MKKKHKNESKGDILPPPPRTQNKASSDAPSPTGYHGYVLFAWLYGIFCGGFHYSLKMYTYEKVRARNFARTWGFVQCSQAIPTAIGVPITGRGLFGR